MLPEQARLLQPKWRHIFERKRGKIYKKKTSSRKHSSVQQPGAGKPGHDHHRWRPGSMFFL
jgi:hypothetical protein